MWITNRKTKSVIMRLSITPLASKKICNDNASAHMCKDFFNIWQHLKAFVTESNDFILHCVIIVVRVQFSDTRFLIKIKWKIVQVWTCLISMRTKLNHCLWAKLLHQTRQLDLDDVIAMKECSIIENVNIDKCGA